MLYESRKFYLCFDTVRLIKNVRNNLLNHKRFLFPSFTFNGFKGTINFTGRELKWKMLHGGFEIEAQLDGAPKLKLKVLHPGSNKENVLLALVIFDETTSAAIQSYFAQHSSAAEFLQLEFFSTTNYLRNAAVLGDEKLAFLRAFTAWLRDW